MCAEFMFARVDVLMMPLMMRNLFAVLAMTLTLSLTAIGAGSFWFVQRVLS